MKLEECINFEEIATPKEYRPKKHNKNILVRKYGVSTNNYYLISRKPLDYNTHCISCYASTLKLHKSLEYENYKVCDTCHQIELKRLQRYTRRTRQ